MEKLEEREHSLSEGYDDEEDPVPAQKPWKKGFSTTIDEDHAGTVVAFFRPELQQLYQTSLRIDTITP